MMNDTNDKAIPKIVDFGLCKIIGPNETANEPFGTWLRCTRSSKETALLFQLWCLVNWLHFVRPIIRIITIWPQRPERIDENDDGRHIKIWTTCLGSCFLVM